MWENFKSFKVDDSAHLSRTPSEQLPPVPLDTLPEQLPADFLTMKVQDYIVGFSGHQ